MSSHRIVALVAFSVILTAGAAHAQPDLSQATVKITPVAAGVYMLEAVGATSGYPSGMTMPSWSTINMRQ